MVLSLRSAGLPLQHLPLGKSIQDTKSETPQELNPTCILAMHADGFRVPDKGDDVRQLDKNASDSGFCGAATTTDVDQRESQKVFIPDLSARKSAARATSVPNFSRVLPRAQTPRAQTPVVRMEPRKRLFSSSSTLRNPCKSMDIKKWNGQSRTYTDWDSLRHVRNLSVLCERMC